MFDTFEYAIKKFNAGNFLIKLNTYPLLKRKVQRSRGLCSFVSGNKI